MKNRLFYPFLCLCLLFPLFSFGQTFSAEPKADLLDQLLSIPWDIPIEEAAKLAQEKTGIILEPYAPDKNGLSGYDSSSNQSIFILGYPAERIYLRLDTESKSRYYNLTVYFPFLFQVCQDDLYDIFQKMYNYLSLRYGELMCADLYCGDSFLFDIPLQKAQFDFSEAALALEKFGDIDLGLAFSNKHLMLSISTDDDDPSLFSGEILFAANSPGLQKEFDDAFSLKSLGLCSEYIETLAE